MQNSIFQLTTSRRGRQPGRSNQHTDSCNFNSRPHEEVDYPMRLSISHNDISTHDLTKRSTLERKQHLQDLTFQLTTSRRGRHVDESSWMTGTDISTHDLTKRSTTIIPDHEVVSIFQLTTSRRGRRTTSTTRTDPSNFNSRPHEEVDLA